jgi:hypothetical protein
LDSITQWMMDPSCEPVFWLTGLAGTGKTAVAQSVAAMATRSNHLGATFFFSRASEERSEYGSVIPTLAYQLAQDLDLRSGILAALDLSKDVAVADIMTQAEQLIFDVLRSRESDPPSCLLIILDALDECKKDINRVHGGDLIPVLLAGFGEFSWIKVLITSRPEPSIEMLFMSEDLDGATLNLALHRDIEEETVRADIAYYLSAELTKLRKRTPNNPDFPTDADVRTLVERANTLFIYARTAMEYVCDPHGQPDRRLAALFKAKPEQSSRQYGRLDSLYSQIMQDTVRGVCKGTIIVDRNLRNVLTTLVLLQHEVPLNSLAAIAEIDEDDCRDILRHISALLNYQYGIAEPVRLMHVSFSDFISDRKRCSELTGYVVDACGDHLRMTERCLEVMNTHLRYNIYLIDNPSLSNAEVGDLEYRIHQHIPGYLRYSCRFWAIHWLEYVSAAGYGSRVPRGMEQFGREHILHWIEALSLVDDFNAVLIVMPLIVARMKVCVVLDNLSRRTLTSEP